LVGLNSVVIWEAIVKFVVTLDRDEDGVWVAQCPSIPGCVSQGSTKDEAIDNVRDAISGCLQTRAELEMPFKIEIQEVEVVV